MDTIIVTCDRSPNNYLAKTVTQLTYQGFFPKIQHGSVSHSNIDEISESDIEKVETFTLLETLNPNFMAQDIRPRHNKNYAAAFMLGNKDSDALILEDDVMPCQNLKNQLDAVYWLIRQRKLDKYIIALYSHAKWPLCAQSLNLYPLERFFGLQAILYSASIRKIIMRAHEDLCEQQPADFITRIAAKENNIPVFATTFSLFQHIGMMTTGLGVFHSTENFLDSTN